MSPDDFFRARLETMIDMRHPLAVLATRMPWKDIEAASAPVLAHKDRAGRGIEGADLFGPTLAVAGAGMSNAGRPRLPIRPMVSLLYLKHAYNESDELTLPLRMRPSCQSRKRTVWPRCMLARTAMMRRGSASMRSMMVLSWYSSRLLACMRAAIPS